MSSEHNNNTTPIVLAIGGHDPGGGAGIQADIESISANQCRATSIISCLTAQDQSGIHACIPQKATDLRAQLETLANSSRIDAVKIGAVVNCEIITCLLNWLETMQPLPIIIDPVINSSSGGVLLDASAMQLFINELLPRAMILTPNIPELNLLSSGHESTEDKVSSLIEKGCSNILVTGTHDATETVVNRLYMKDRQVINFEYPRLEDEYHGSGCTLASAIAARLVIENNIETAVKKALDFTWQSLDAAETSESRQYRIPNRILSIV